jgi:hypothetical protein
MSRASRTAEILAAAGLVPLQLEQERIRAGRDAARSTALASLLPALIDTGAGIAGRVAQADLAERKFAADLEARKARDAAVVEARKAKDAAAAETERKRVEALAAKAAADMAKANAEARATNITGAASDTESLISRPGGVSQAELERVAVARGLPASDWRTVLGARDTAVDETAALAAKARQGEAAAKLAERKATAPLGGGAKQPSPDAAMRSEKLRLEVERLRNEAAGGPGSARANAAMSATEKKRQQVLEVENFTSNIDRNIDAIKAQIDKTGTFELTGPEGAVMDRRLTEIATDLAKLADPGSVARSDEVKLMRQGLVDSGFLGLATRNETAKAVLDALKGDVMQRRSAAYLARGLEMPAATGAAPAVAMPATRTKAIAEMTDQELADYEAALKGRKQ